MITQNYTIDLIPSGEPVVVHVSQYDTLGRTLAFELYNGGVAWDIPAGATASIAGTKPDGTGFTYAMTVSGNTCSIDIPQQMALVAGDVPAEIRITSGSGIIGSANFIIRVERAALDEETAISETDIPVFEQLVQQAQSAATAAGQSATNAGNAATAAGQAQAAAEALIPAAGTTGQYLQKTASGTVWADVDALPAGGTAGQVLTKQSGAAGDAAWDDPAGTGGNLIVTVTNNGGVYSADHTFAEIEANIAAGGHPYVRYSTMVFTLHSYTAGSSAAFVYFNNNGGYYVFTINSSGVTYGANGAYMELSVTLAAANWSGGVYTISSSSIPAAANGIVTITAPNVTTLVDLQTQVAAFREADLQLFNQLAGSVQVAALGTVPIADIDVVIVVQRRY